MRATVDVIEGDHRRPRKSGASRRDVPMAPVVANTLKEWKLKCPPGGLVFANTIGKLESHSNVRARGLGPIQKAAGLCEDESRPKYGLHAFRHAAASLWIEQDVKPKQIQEWMGHSTITLTFDTYGHLFPAPKSDAEVMARVQARVLG